MTNAIPSVDPALYDSLAGMVSLVIDKMMQGTDGVLPAQVLGSRRASADGPALVQVQPLVKMLTTDGAQVSRAQVADVPVWQYGGGGVVLSFDLPPGTMGLLIACDRDTSLFVQSGAEAPPNTLRKKDFSSSFFLPMTMYGINIAPEDAGSAVLQTLDGTVKIAIDESGVTIAGDTEFKDDVTIDGDLTVTGDLKVTGRVIAFGDLASGGNITAAGTITPGTPIPP